MINAILEHARCLILQCLASASPLGARESLLLSAIDDAKITPLVLRHELVHLHEQGFVVLFDRRSSNWHAKLAPRVSQPYAGPERRQLH